MSAADIQGWTTLAVTLLLLLRTLLGDSKKGIEKGIDSATSELKRQLSENKAETANVRAVLSDFQLKVATEYARTDQLGPRLDRIEGMLTDVLMGRRHER